MIASNRGRREVIPFDTQVRHLRKVAPELNGAASNFGGIGGKQRYTHLVNEVTSPFFVSRVSLLLRRKAALGAVINPFNKSTTLCHPFGGLGPMVEWRSCCGWQGCTLPRVPSIHSL